MPVELQRLLGLTGWGFEDMMGRAAIFARVRELSSPNARAFYAAALEHELPGHLAKEIAVELERLRFADFAPKLAEVPGLALHVKALTALGDAEPCVCVVYAEHPANAASPLMEQVRVLETTHPQVEECEYRCQVCGASLVHRQEHHERGATLHLWRFCETV